MPPPPSKIEQASSGLLLLLGLNAFRSVKQLAEIKPSTLAALLAFAYFWTDLTGACMHIVLDDPTSRSIPILGYSAVMFQRHHEHPLGMMEESWCCYICRHHTAMATFTFLATCVLRPHSRSLLAFFIFANLWWVLMVASHRWAHYEDQAEVPGAVAFLQQSNLLISHEGHLQHHTTFTSNFAFLSGWSDVLIMPALSVCPCTSTGSWFGVLLLSGLIAPVALADIVDKAVDISGSSSRRRHLRKTL
jgi:hypothetical protein